MRQTFLSLKWRFKNMDHQDCSRLWCCNLTKTQRSLLCLNHYWSEAKKIVPMTESSEIDFLNFPWLNCRKLSMLFTSLFISVKDWTLLFWHNVFESLSKNLCIKYGIIKQTSLGLGTQNFNGAKTQGFLCPRLTVTAHQAWSGLLCYLSII